MENTDNQLCPTCGMSMSEGDHNHDSAPEAAPAEGGNDAGMEAPAAPQQPEAPAADAPTEDAPAATEEAPAEGGEDAGM